MSSPSCLCLIKERGCVYWGCWHGQRSLNRECNPAIWFSSACGETLYGMMEYYIRSLPIDKWCEAGRCFSADFLQHHGQNTVWHTHLARSVERLSLAHSWWPKHTGAILMRWLSVYHTSSVWITPGVILSRGACKSRWEFLIMTSPGGVFKLPRNLTYDLSFILHSIIMSKLLPGCREILMQTLIIQFTSLWKSPNWFLFFRILCNHHRLFCSLFVFLYL